jgi:hypothetical protein
MTEYWTPPNETRIERLYAFLSIDEKGNNGVVASILPGIGAAQMIFGTRELAKKMIPIAQQVADKTGLDVGLYVFARVEGGRLWRSE